MAAPASMPDTSRSWIDNDETPAEDLGGRFACGLCADNRDAAEAAEADIRRLNAALNRAHSLLRLIQRAEVKPLRSEGLDHDPTAQSLLGHVSAWAVLQTRIQLFFDGEREGEQ